MRIAIASGKGGAGKTTVAASLAAVWQTPAILVDADVEAPNLHLFCSPAITSSTSTFLEVPILDATRCTQCGTCREVCRFMAFAKLGKTISLFPEMCHGCGGCIALCPEKALAPGQRLLGTLECGTAMQGRHAFLMGRSRIGEAMTPPQLRALQKKLAAMLAASNASVQPCTDALIDAPPGVSCPAMTVAQEADIILLVVEPTPFGIHDFTLAHRAFAPLQKPVAVVLNRAGIPGNAGDQELAAYCQEQGLPLLGTLPFSQEIAGHYAQGGIAASCSPAWEKHFTQLREALQAFATKERAHA